MAIPNKKKLGTKLLFYSLINVLIPIMLFGFVVTDTLNNILDDKAQSEVTTGISSLEQAINLKITEISITSNYITTTPGIIKGINERDKEELLLRINHFKSVSDADFVGIIDKDGKLITSTANDVNFEIEEISKELFKNNIESSFEVISSDTAYLIDNTSKIEGVDKALSIVVLKPIFDDNNQYIGSIIAIDILNNNFHMINDVKKITGSDATLFLGNKRITTSITHDGKKQVGTEVSSLVWDYIQTGNDYKGTTEVLGVSYITIYRPIYNSKNELIGMMFVGSPQTYAAVAKNEIKEKIIIIAILCILLSVITSTYSNYRIKKPIMDLKRGTEEFGKGNYEYKTNIKSGDELELLSNSFDKMAEKIAISNKELEKRALELEEKNTELKKLDDLKSDLIAIVSHEIRTPLTSIKGYVELVLDEAVGKINNSQRKCLTTARENVVRLNRLISSMLDLSKLAKGELEMHREEINIKKTIDEVIDDLKPISAEKNINITLEIDDIIINADKDRMKQVFINLIENAIKFSPENEIIEIKGKEEYHGDVSITVKDNGEGIPKDKLEKVFDRFYQADLSPKRKGKGTGLGLAVCKSIIQAHGGSIWVKSEIGKGCTFYIVLPKNIDN
ncbi:integral membrane sensor signal transduction histidine kinase [Methanococcus vannielii SB]|uniref:histidine kinase n=1 Tax=Methanococcus vannielii (strain ATCC 35089 / DSM 1224 / JCM 13029 / OCM 148 / SB) TaxID=406327 RepID=A6UNH9_METVS|nr:ATP-binding protein [Methanococcus vannielii]ABR54051.1 integral membrane sensor signal transduction histidine kinase [Methanococcus vannielii SB]